MLSIFSLLTFPLLLVDAGHKHPIYISLCTIDIAEDRSWSGELRIFYDDLEDALQYMTGNRPNLSKHHLPDHRAQILDYLQAKFLVKSDQRHPFSISALERKNDLVFVLIKGHNEWPIKSPTITNQILLELFEAQKNILKLRFRDQQRLIYFNKTNPEQLIP